MPLRLLLADDHQIVRYALRVVLEQAGFEVIAEAAHGHDAVRLAKTHAFDVAILDISMPQLNGIDAARAILQTSPKAGIILLTVHYAEHQIIPALRAGIRGYVLKAQALEELVQAIKEVARGGMYLGPGVSRFVVDTYLAGSAIPADPLTVREREVLQLIAEGRTTKEVASLLGVSAKTAESYRARLMQRLDIHETAGLVRYAIRHGIISP